MDYAILKKPDETLFYVAQIATIADKNKKSFGFLSASAYEQMASKGQLWVALNSKKELKGYLMFGGVMPTLKIFQVYACQSVRGHGLGSILIEELKKFAQSKNYHSIVAKVASDLPANVFWEKSGFLVHRQVKGGDTTKRTINLRGCSLEGNDLFGDLNKEKTKVQPIGPVLERPIYAMDLNLLFDIFQARPGYQKVIKIMQIGFQGGFSICITPEFKKELERQSSKVDDDPILRLAGAFPELKTDFNIVEISSKLKNIIFPDRNNLRKSAQNDNSDLAHLSYCISAGIRGFITREKALLRACNEIKDRYGVSILSPDELITEDDSASAATPLNSDFAFTSSPITDEIRKFISAFSSPSPITEALLINSPIKNAISVYESRLDEKLFGVFFFEKPSKATQRAVATLYLDESCPQSIAAIDHFLEMTLRHKSGFLHRLDFYVGNGQYLTEETLLKRGFFKSTNHYVKIISTSFLDSKSWPRFAKDLKQLCGFTAPEKIPTKKELQNTGVCLTDCSSRTETISWFDFETVIGPRFILSNDRSCILVPIREIFANSLIGNTKNQLSLLASNEKSFLLEKAYFRSVKNAAIFKKGQIIAFYVSGTKSIQEIIGFARVTYSDTINIDEAIVKLDRQGVLSREELINIMDPAENVHVFTFDNFLEFDKRIPFARAKQLGLISNANLVSPEKIPFQSLKKLIGEAFNG